MTSGDVVTVSAGTGPYGQVKFGTRFAQSDPKDSFVLDASHYRTDGYREHSQARRDQLNAKWEPEVSADTRVSVVANALSLRRWRASSDDGPGFKTISEEPHAVTA